ncbi:MAG: GxxExxY protein [Lacunisphaera sp.]
MIVNDLVIVDPKVVEHFASSHVAQMVGYLAIINLRLALLLNFKRANLRWNG